MCWNFGSTTSDALACLKCGKPKAEHEPTDTDVLNYILPIITGEDGVDNRTLAIGGALLMGKSGREAIIAAMRATG